jgi:hypothetical protein
MQHVVNRLFKNAQLLNDIGTVDFKRGNQKNNYCIFTW